MNSVNGSATDFNDLQANFNSFTPEVKFPVGTAKNYVLKSSFTTNPLHTRFAVALSNYLIKVYDTSGDLNNEYAHDCSISDIKFSTTEPCILFTSSLDGKIRVWDSRSQLCVQTFYDDSDGFSKPISCFDYNQEESLICAGTELIREDAFHLFWDRRSSKILGGYWDSHAADITQINFHPQNTSWMSSSSVDGLVNIFDLKEESEDEALIETINIEAPVNTFRWISEDVLSCITSIEGFHLIKLGAVHSILSTSREQLLKDFQISTDCMIDSLPIMNNFFLATGKNTGAVHLWNIDKSYKCNPTGYLLKGHTDAVRTICYNDDTGILLTGGDDGCVCLWKLNPLREKSQRKFS